MKAADFWTVLGKKKAHTLNAWAIINEIFMPT